MRSSLHHHIIIFIAEYFAEKILHKEFEVAAESFLVMIVMEMWVITVTFASQLLKKPFSFRTRCRKAITWIQMERRSRLDRFNLQLTRTRAVKVETTQLWTIESNSKRRRTRWTITIATQLRWTIRWMSLQLEVVVERIVARHRLSFSRRIDQNDSYYKKRIKCISPPNTEKKIISLWNQDKNE